MAFSWMLKTFLASLLLPPLNALVLLLVAAFFRRRRWAFGLAVAAALLLTVQALKPVSHGLIEPLERRAGPVISSPGQARAIVVLGGGRNRNALEYGGESIAGTTLERVRYGAVLARRFKLPVLVTGGRPDGGEYSEAALMAGVMERELGVAVRWQEGKSNDTAENAKLSALMLRAAGIDEVVLVTHAFHMARAQLAFERTGLRVNAAPLGFSGGAPVAPHEWLPQVGALRQTAIALHEWIGLGWYALNSR